MTDNDKLAKLKLTLGEIDSDLVLRYLDVDYSLN